jgi:hypothetical protein
MERNYSPTTSAYIHPDELHWRTAFHEAGHAAAIYLRNRRKQLPPIFFEIQIKPPSANNGPFFAKVIDGNLIQSLPIAVVESLSTLSGHQQHSCQRAYEADVVNLLVGPLAEAKYVAIRDGEVFNHRLIRFEALSNYGGYSDLEEAQNYLEHFIASKSARGEKMAELLVEAYQFIDNSWDWRCIQNLASYILASGLETISCDEVSGIFEKCCPNLALEY